jgi:PAS domain S-box-containing protein
MEFLRTLFSPNDFMPHGFCYSWNAGLVWLHVISDSLIALSYLSIPVTLVYFIRKRRDLPFHWMFVCFGVFILACGATHAMEVWTLWHANYWLSGAVKVVTAVASLTTAVLLVKLVPRALALPSPEELRREIVERTQAQLELAQAKSNLELRVEERTAEIAATNKILTQEILRRAKTEEELRGSEERFRLLIEGVRDYAILSLTPTGYITSWNVGAEHIKGYQADEIIGQHFSRFYTEEDLERGRPQTALVTAMDEGRSEDEGWRVRKDGSRFWANVVITPLRDQEGKLIGFSKITRDLSERKQAENVVQAARSELARMARVTTVGELTASVAHEINQPLAAIVNNANACTRMLANQSPDIEELREAIADIAQSVTRASEIVSHTRAFFKKTIQDKAQIDLNQIIHEVLSLTAAEAEKNHVAVQTELATGLPPVLGARVELQQVVLNLVMNGIEAMTSVKEERKLHISSQPQEPGKVLVTVQDSGGGLDPQHAVHIFDSFFTTKPEGMGMGLPISRSIVEAHGGQLKLVPMTRQGATFQFTLPACA